MEFTKSGRPILPDDDYDNNLISAQLAVMQLAHLHPKELIAAQEHIEEIGRRHWREKQREGIKDA
ncbi:MAG: hypothetical protein HY764_00120 [Candidatus Portnoybacteria bacterium]|nr:hypothetical protein [Candidatus Portnoybacteria bacterium]